MEKVLVIDPASDDDLNFINHLFTKGWNSATEIPMNAVDDDRLLIFYRLEFCESCSTNRQEEPEDAQDEDEADAERKRKEAEFEDYLRKRKKDKPEDTNG